MFAAKFEFVGSFFYLIDIVKVFTRKVSKCANAF